MRERERGRENVKFISRNARVHATHAYTQRTRTRNARVLTTHSITNILIRSRPNYKVWLTYSHIVFGLDVRYEYQDMCCCNVSRSSQTLQQTKISVSLQHRLIVSFRALALTHAVHRARRTRTPYDVLRTTYAVVRALTTNIPYDLAWDYSRVHWTRRVYMDTWPGNYLQMPQLISQTSGWVRNYKENLTMFLRGISK